MSGLQVKKTKLAGCFEIIPNPFCDDRGRLLKTFHQELFGQNNLQTHFAEQYVSHSFKGVLRGLHFQVPPFQHVKLVYCVYGHIRDAVVDLRAGSPAYGEYALFDLRAETGNMVYVPAGLAHGFYVVSEQAIVVNNASTIYSPAHESGIRWDSAGIPWGDEHPRLSAKDKELPPLSAFASPFTYQPDDGLFERG